MEDLMLRFRSRRLATSATALVRRRLRALVVLAATLGVAAIGVAGVAGPAQADDGGNTFCWLGLSGSITATPDSYAPFEPVVQWDVSAPYCSSYEVYISGPGFTPDQPVSSLVTDVYLYPGQTATWTLYIVDTGTGDDAHYTLASTSYTEPS
jgi:hypothetical protein